MTSLDERVAALLHRTERDAAPGDPVAAPIVSTSTYALPGDPAGPWQYGRWSNPTWTALEEALGVLEDAEVIALPSGMAAIAATLYACTRAGDRVRLPADGYMATRGLAERFLAPYGVAVETCPTVEAAARPADGLRLLWVETPSNPGLDCVDIAQAAATAHAAGALLVADNTTMTPLGQRPLDLGADLVVSADTKAINGHSDVLFGHVATRDPRLAAAVRDWRKLAGAIPGAFEAWLVLRGLQTLELRWARMTASAQAIAERLAAHRAPLAVRYPGLSSHPAHELARRQMTGGGSLIALTLADAAAAERFIAACPLMRAATSFGGLHTSAERRARWGDAVAPGFVRLSVGCEPLEPLWRAIDAALAAA